MIYENEKTNPAVAIYHYQQYLRFDPKAGNAEIIAGRIYNCKVELAKGLFVLPSSPAMLQQLQQLTEKNRQLQGEIEQWQAYFAAQPASGKTNLPPPSGTGNQASQPAAAMMSSTPTTLTPGPVATRPRTHTVVARDTPAAIARKYGVSLDALMAANPGLNPKKLHVGQSRQPAAALNRHEYAHRLSLHRGLLGHHEFFVVARGIQFAWRRRAGAGGTGLAKNFDRAG